MINSCNKCGCAVNECECREDPAYTQAYPTVPVPLPENVVIVVPTTWSPYKAATFRRDLKDFLKEWDLE